MPTYLRGVPRDPFGGAPFRYDHDRAVLYSIGANLTDEGGQQDDSDYEDMFDGDDIVFPIFSPSDTTNNPWAP